MVSSFSFREDLQVGDRVGVACTVIKGDSPISLFWEKDGTPLLNEGLSNVNVTTFSEISSFLLLSELKPEHVGTYTCKAANSWANHSHSAKLNVNGMRAKKTVTDWSMQFSINLA